MSIARRHALTGWTKLAHLGIGGTEIVGCVGAENKGDRAGNKRAGGQRQEGRRRKGEKGQEVRDRRREEAERRGMRETERETEGVWVGKGGTQRAKGAGQRRQARQQVDKGEVEKTET